MSQTTSYPLLLVGVLGLSLLGCDTPNELRSSAPTRSAMPADATIASKAAGQPLFEEIALAAAGEYRNWSLVDDAWRWAPQLCSAPMTGRSVTIPTAGLLRASASTDATSHGRKIYRIFAKDAPAYATISKGIGSSPAQLSEQFAGAIALRNVTQVIVKESWIPPLADAADPGAAAAGAKPLKQSALFMMLKVDDGKQPDTDEGWIYATVTPDCKEVTGVGRIQTCIQCHADAPHGRLFGLKPTDIREKDSARSIIRPG